MLSLASGFAQQGFHVDLVVAEARGPYVTQIPPTVRLVDLKVNRTLAALPALVKYLRFERPLALISALDHANVVALWAKGLTGGATKLVVTVQSTMSIAAGGSRSIFGKLIPLLARWFYPWADQVVAASCGVAEDLVSSIGVPSDKISVIYNPVVRRGIFERAGEVLDHPWFEPGAVPVVLAVGRLTKAKDYPVLLKAFSLVRTRRQVRLLILGDGEERDNLVNLAIQMGIEGDVCFAGFVNNPYAYMVRANVFALSSQWEGLPTVLIEALALGVPVVSTDCRSGPREILDNGRFGILVPVGDSEALAEGIIASLDSPQQGVPETAWLKYTVEEAVEQYNKVLTNVERKGDDH